MAGGLPAFCISLVFLFGYIDDREVSWTFTIIIVLTWFGLSYAVRNRVMRPLQTFAALVGALRDGDYTVRARGETSDDVLGQMALEVNALSKSLRSQRLGAMEASALLHKVINEIEAAIFAFDSDSRLRLVNRSGERLLGQPAEALMGQTAGELGLDDCLASPIGRSTRTLQLNLRDISGRWSVYTTTFRESGIAHRLLVLSDLSRPLRAEELKAWQRLVRVLGHEINNSLAPIKSIAGSMATLVAKEEKPDDWAEDMRRGLNVISSRAEALGRFTESYASLARLPTPILAPVPLGPLVERVVGLETRLRVKVHPGPSILLFADQVQLEQLLINLVRNAVDAVQSTGGSVEITWNLSKRFLELTVDDEGCGLASTANLFVPFFTTKPNGSGVGLVLSRQIAEGHGGTLTLSNRTDVRGCRAILRLPLASHN
jgi:two-component system, NtrC family, nitrogen regulation sensor histidine kinase NtrY